MDTSEFLKVADLDREGKHEDAFRLLLHLANHKHPLALFELSSRYYSTEGFTPSVYPLKQDLAKSKALARDGEACLRKLAEQHDGEAMRMLAYAYLGHLCPHYKDVGEAEKWLLQAYEAGCYFAANDLHTFYLGSDQEKSKYWYMEAEKRKCRVVYYEEFEA